MRCYCFKRPCAITRAIPPSTATEASPRRTVTGSASNATPPNAAPRLAQGLMALLALVLVLYLVAPTAQQLIATLAVLRPRPGEEDRP